MEVLGYSSQARDVYILPLGHYLPLASLNLIHPYHQQPRPLPNGQQHLLQSAQLWSHRSSASTSVPLAHALTLVLPVPPSIDRAAHSATRQPFLFVHDYRPLSF